MPFDAALDCIDYQLPEEVKAIFYDSLDKTILSADIEGIREPSKVQLADTGMIQELSLDYVASEYLRVYCQYNDVSIEDAFNL